MKTDEELRFNKEPDDEWLATTAGAAYGRGPLYEG